MFRSRGFVALVAAIVGVAMIALVVGTADAQGRGFTPTFRSDFTRIKVSHISNGEPFKPLNPLNADLVGFLTTYANDTALRWYLQGKKGPAPNGSAIVVELSKFDSLAGGAVLSEKAGPNPTVWMIKDAAAPKETGGWRWELWLSQGGKDVNAGLDAKTQAAGCVMCHQQLNEGVAAKTDLVFSTFTDLAHAQNLAQKFGVRLDPSLAVPAATRAATRAATAAAGGGGAAATRVPPTRVPPTRPVVATASR